MTKPVVRFEFPLSDVEAALLRSAAYARELARRTRTPLVIVRDGRILRLIPGETPDTDVLLTSTKLEVDPQFRDAPS
ncbi:MAG: hypothetical protein ABIP49_08845 [Lysobacterales bacterium]